ncbi:hypothetical protein J2128_000321 [Methanomicrobium sp. W14]|uniref:calcium-dependent protein kinase n=1 Tax=Methanomicrobium sp. W14 TaxID=2817839 RepID=UPI001AEB9D72|nr:calcium-dependent protein kinase [Methanomicrobium sp. W14]MBP2132400.1 hypothetical protein [Methanomicrobium sp. W14]
MEERKRRRIILGIILVIAVSACIAFSAEIIGNISGQAYISENPGNSSGKYLIILNTQLPDEKDAVTLYKINNTKADPEEIDDIAAFFGLKGELKDYIENTGEFIMTDGSDQKRQVSYYSRSGAVVYSVPDLEFPNTVEEQPNLPYGDEAVDIADSFLKKTGMYEEESFVKTAGVNQKQQVWSGGSCPKESYNVTVAVSYARELDGMPVYGDEFSVVIGDGGEVVGMTKNWREAEPFGDVAIKTAEDAYDDLCSRRTVSNLSIAGYDKIIVDNISLGYLMEPRIYQQDELKPVYLFSGTAFSKGEERPYAEYVYASK